MKTFGNKEHGTRKSWKKIAIVIHIDRMKCSQVHDDVYVYIIGN